MFALLIESLIYLIYEIPFTKKICKCPYGEYVYQGGYIKHAQQEELSVDDNPYVLNFMLQS